MLRKAVAEDIAKYGDFVYELALDQTKSAYPTYADGIKTREDFLAAARKAVAEDTSELLLFFRGDVLEGWIQYFWILEDHYLQCDACNIRRGTAQALGELLKLLRADFPGYTFYFGFPACNVEAVCFLRENGFRCVEEAWNNTYFLESRECSSEDENIGHENIIRIGRNNYDQFRAVYRPDEETYWNCDRILECLEDWAVFVYREEQNPVGTIFFRGNKGYYEIYGMDFAEGKYRREVCLAMLTAALNDCRRAGAKYLTYFCDSCEEALQKAVQEAGFHCVGGYVCYILEPEKV